VVAFLLNARSGRPVGSEALPPTILAILVGAVTVFVGATGSRTGAVLMLPAIGLTLLAMWAGRLPFRAATFRLGRVMFMAAGAALLMWLLGAERLLSALGRTRILEDNRLDFWPTVWTAAQAYFPWGAGLGTFKEAYELVEPLGALRALFVNHAHNEYLEVMIEAGLPGLLLVSAVLIWVGRVSWRVWLSPGGHPASARLASICLVLVILHSLVDYPARTMAISILFAAASALVVRSASAAAFRLNSDLQRSSGVAQ
jgi:O-antigen ligase